MRALDDVTVLDLSHALAGPFCSTMLADYGAEVIKIETPGAGDMARAWGPPFYGEEAAYFVNLHRNKKSVAIDLKHPDGKALFFKLLEGADVVLENLRVGAVQRLGHRLALRARVRIRGIIYCSISGFGQDGPYRDRAALDLIVQAESGMISVTGPAGGAGVRAGVSIADIGAGMFAAFAILSALHARHRTGRGQFVYVSMLEGQLSLLQGVVGAYLADGIVPGPWGTAYASLLPIRRFGRNPRPGPRHRQRQLWRTFCPLIELRRLADRPALCDERRAHCEPRVTHRHVAASVSGRSLRRMGSVAAGRRHSGWRHRHDRPCRRSSAGRRTRHPRRLRASDRRGGEGRGATRETLRNASRHSSAGPASRCSTRI